MYRLLFMNGNLKGKRLTIKQGDLLFGSGEDCHVRIQDDERVAGHHAVLEYKHGQATLRDLGALNKVEVNDHPVVEQRLRHGDRLAIGDTIVEFHAPGARTPPHQRRRFSKMQATSIAAIGGVVLLQVGFVLLFPIWQRNAALDVASKQAEQLPPASSETPQSNRENAEALEAQPEPVTSEIPPEELAGVPPSSTEPEVSAQEAASEVTQPVGYEQEQEARAEIAEARDRMERVAEDVSVRMKATVNEQRISIFNVESDRFPASDEYEEMRRLRILIRTTPELGMIDGEEVRVTVQFFDRVEGGGDVVSTLMRVQSDGLKVEGDWPAGEARTVSAAYVVPKGYRQRETSLLGERRRYEGYVVSVFYREVLQDRYALPRDLLALSE
ncbi:MAG: FHA domain-containing protein [Kiritimatiellia bacterium]